MMNIACLLKMVFFLDTPARQYGIRFFNVFTMAIYSDIETGFWFSYVLLFT